MPKMSSKMDRSDLEKLQEYNLEIKRCPLRYCGIGSRLEEDCSKLWPRDAIDPNEECRKLFHTELRKLVPDKSQITRIETVIRDMSESLKKCRVDLLVEKFCEIRKNALASAGLNCYIAHTQIYGLIHNILRSIKIGKEAERSLRYLFGSNYNFKVFRLNLHVLVSGNAKLRCVRLGNFISFETKSMELNSIPWLNGVCREPKYRIFMQVIFFLVRFISRALKRYFYITISNPYAEQIFYFRYDIWQKMKDKKINELISQKLLAPVDLRETQLDALGDTSKIRFLLKKNDIRLICTRQGKPKDSELAYKTQAVLQFLLNKMPYSKNWNLADFMKDLKDMKAKSQISDGNYKPIYFVRADFEDCYHSINQQKLIAIIKNLLRTYYPTGIITLRKLHCVLRRPPRSDRREVSKYSCTEHSPTKRSNILFAEEQNTERISIAKFIVEYLEPIIRHPVLRVSKKSTQAYLLLRGIRQGSKYSPALSAIYVHRALIEFMGRGILADEEGKFFRYADDLLYMTMDLAKAMGFVYAMLSNFPGFGLRSNPDKLFCNFDCPDVQVGKLKDGVVFFKRHISLKDLGCSHVFSHGPCDVGNTFQLSPYTTARELRHYVLRWSKIETIHLDFELNGRWLVMQNLLEHAKMVAYRVATVIITSFIFRENKVQQVKLIKYLAEQVAARMYHAIEIARKRGQIYNDLEFPEVTLITAAAFLATWRTHKMDGRKLERDKLKAFFRRKLAQYRTNKNNQENQPPQESTDLNMILRFQKQLRLFTHEHTQSLTWSCIRLPSK